MPRKLHWTQTPEGREKMSRIRAAAARSRRKENGNGSMNGHAVVPPEVDLQSYRTGYRDGFEDGRRAAPAA